MKILFIDTVHPFLKQKLEKKKYICDAAYDKSKAEIKEIIHNYQGVIIPDHTPALNCEAPWHAGMAYALGYIKGLIQSN